MGRLFPFKKPVFTLSCPPFGEVRARVCSKGVYDKIQYLLTTGSGDISEIMGEIPVENLPGNICLTYTTCFEFLTNYRNAVEKYCEENIDIFGIPKKEEFETEEPVRLPLVTVSERLVYEHTGINFREIDELDILDYRLLLADAMKWRILQRQDGKGREYLNECYDCMHKNSDIFG